MPDHQKRLLLLDGHSLAYRAFFALPVENFSTTTGQHTNAVFGFTSMLINVLRDEQPTHIGVAFDKSRNTFRLQEYAEYKAKRNKTPDEFSSQLPLIDEVLDALKIRHLRKEGFEADDIIATLVDPGPGRRLRRADPLRRPRRLPAGHRAVDGALPDARRLRAGADDPDAVEARYGVPPARYPDLAAIVGETSDNLPGSRRRPGLRRPLAQRVRRPRQRDHPRRQDHRQEGRGAARAPRRRDPQPPPQRAGPRPRPRARSRRPRGPVRGTASWCTRCSTPLEFRVLRERLLESWDVQHEPIDESGFELAGSRLAPGEVEAWLTEHTGEGRTGVTVQGRWGSGTGEVWSVALAAADGTGAWLDAGEVSPEDDAAVMTWFDDPATPRCCTTRRARCSPWRRAAGRCGGWSATPPWRRTSPGPTSAPTTWPT